MKHRLVAAASAGVALAVVAGCLVIAQSDDGRTEVGHYTVRSGDTSAMAIARRLCGPSAPASLGAQVLAMNRDLFAVLNVGEVLHVPTDCPEVTPSTVAPTTAAPSTTSTTSAPTTTSTVAPSSTTTSTVAPSTTVPPATTTTAAATTTSVASPSTTAPTASTSTTQPPVSGSFFEDFADPTAFETRFDHAWSGEWNAGALFGGDRNDWPADHDMACGNPNQTHRTIHLTGQAQANDAAFYACLPGGNPAAGHVMTSVNTEGYVIAWFSPKQTFDQVSRVCWDQNLTDLKGGKWTQVILVTAAQAARNGGDLGYAGPGFQARGGPSTFTFADDYSLNSGIGGAKMFGGNFQIWRGSTITGELDWWSWDGQHQRAEGYTDKAPRYRHCMVDHEDGTVTISQARPNGTTRTQTVNGDLPDGPVRVVFQDDNYNPDKHQVPEVDGNTSVGYTWHWDNVEIS